MNDLVERLKKLDTCAVSDACDSLKVTPGQSGLPRLATTKRIAGKVVTVKLGSSKPEGVPSRHLGTAAIEAAEAGDVIVVEQRTGIEAGSWGGVLSNAAQTAGVAGVVCDGPARDIDEAIELDFPVFARSSTARTARGRVFEVDFNCTIEVGDATVEPGDLVIADATAVVFLPKDKAADIIAAAERITEKERLMTIAARRGDKPSEVMGANYETMLDNSGKD